MKPDEQDSSVFDVIAEEQHEAPIKQVAEPEKQKPTETSKTEVKPEVSKETQTKTPKVEEAEEDEDQGKDTQDFSHKPIKSEPVKAEDTEPLQTETETKTEEAETVDDNWKATLPPAPVAFAFPEPQVNEEGQIVNMGPAEYQQYLVERAKYEMRTELYHQNVENKALDAAEKILPELKTNPSVRKLVESTRTASILNGQQIDSYEAAKLVRDALGLSADRLAKAKAEGEQSAKTSITVQKRSQIESRGSSQAKPTASTADKLAKRLRQGDDEAFAELFESWDKEGKI